MKPLLLAKVVIGMTLKLLIALFQQILLKSEEEYYEF
jgi:hypothetical protein